MSAEKDSIFIILSKMYTVGCIVKIKSGSFLGFDKSEKFDFILILVDLGCIIAYSVISIYHRAWNEMAFISFRCDIYMLIEGANLSH